MSALTYPGYVSVLMMLICTVFVHHRM